MNIKDILSKTDHTLLSPDAKWEDIKQILDDAMKYKAASACIPASYVKSAKEYTKGQLTICTVIGFPLGYSTASTKCFEAGDAVANGADEIDMVINIGKVKDGLFDEVLDEIKSVKKACKGKLLKVIIETCLLTDEEKIKMCIVISKSGADYIKTSTGFSSAGANAHDIKLFAENCAPNVKIKAAGGISSLEDAENFISLGASRLGSSRIIKLVKEQNLL